MEQAEDEKAWGQLHAGRAAAQMERANVSIDLLDNKKNAVAFADHGGESLTMTG